MKGWQGTLRVVLIGMVMVTRTAAWGQSLGSLSDIAPALVILVLVSILVVGLVQNKDAIKQAISTAVPASPLTTQAAAATTTTSAPSTSVRARNVRPMDLVSQ